MNREQALMETNLESGSVLGGEERTLRSSIRPPAPAEVSQQAQSIPQIIYTPATARRPPPPREGWIVRRGGLNPGQVSMAASLAAQGLSRPSGSVGARPAQEPGLLTLLETLESDIFGFADNFDKSEDWQYNFSDEADNLQERIDYARDLATQKANQEALMRLDSLNRRLDNASSSMFTRKAKLRPFSNSSYLSPSFLHSPASEADFRRHKEQCQNVIEDVQNGSRESVDVSQDGQRTNNTETDNHGSQFNTTPPRESGNSPPQARSMLEGSYDVNPHLQRHNPPSDNQRRQSISDELEDALLDQARQDADEVLAGMGGGAPPPAQPDLSIYFDNDGKLKHFSEVLRILEELPAGEQPPNIQRLVEQKLCQLENRLNGLHNSASEILGKYKTVESGVARCSEAITTCQQTGQKNESEIARTFNVVAQVDTNLQKFGEEQIKRVTELESRMNARELASQDVSAEMNKLTQCFQILSAEPHFPQELGKEMATEIVQLKSGLAELFSQVKRLTRSVSSTPDPASQPGSPFRASSRIGVRNVEEPQVCSGNSAFVPLSNALSNLPPIYQLGVAGISSCGPVPTNHTSIPPFAPNLASVGSIGNAASMSSNLGPTVAVNGQRMSSSGYTGVVMGSLGPVYQGSVYRPRVPIPQGGVQNQSQFQPAVCHALNPPPPPFSNSANLTVQSNVRQQIQPTMPSLSNVRPPMSTSGGIYTQPLSHSPPRSEENQEQLEEEEDDEPYTRDRMSQNYGGGGFRTNRTHQNTIKDLLTIQLDQLQDLIIKVIDDTTAKEIVHEAYSSTLPQVERCKDTCSQLLLKYTQGKGDDAVILKRATRIIKEASDWTVNVRTTAQDRQTYSKPVHHEFRQSIPPFANDGKMNVFQFIRLFEENFSGVGSLEWRGEILVTKYLSLRIRNQVASCNFDYDKVRSFLVKRYGSIKIITTAIIEDLRALKKPTHGASYKQMSDYLNQLVAGIHRIKNLQSIPELDEPELVSHTTSPMFLQSVVDLIPESLQIEFNKSMVDGQLDPSNLSGSNALNATLAFVEREALAYDSLAGPSRPNVQRNFSKPPQKSTHCISQNEEEDNLNESFMSENDYDQVSSEEEENVILQSNTLNVSNVTSGSKNSPKKSKSSRPTGTQKVVPKWYDPNLKQPCPIDQHKHELGTCNEFLGLKCTERTKVSKGKLCFACLYPWEGCRKACSRLNKLPKELLCTDCQQTPKKVPLNILICSDSKHTKPPVKDILLLLKKNLIGFDKARIQLSTNFFMGNFVQDCNLCGKAKSCKCSVPTKSSSPSSKKKTPCFDTETGKPMKVSEDNVIHEIPEATVFCMQWLRFGEKDFLTFYDRGSSTHLVNGQMAEDVGIKVVNPRPSTLTVVGGATKSTEYGTYKMRLGAAETNQAFEVYCQGMDQITSKFPKFKLSKINKELKSFKTSLVGSNEKLPAEIGGSEAHLLIGIKDTTMEPQLMFTLPSGLGVYRSKFKDKFGSTICYGGPHRAFTEALKSMGTDVNLHITLFLNTYNTSLQHIQPPAIEEIDHKYDLNDLGVYVQKDKGKSYSIDLDDGYGAKVFPTALTKSDFEDSEVDTGSDHFDVFESVPPAQNSAVVTAPPMPDNLPNWSRPQNDVPLSMQNPFHKCPVLKAKIPLSKLREIIDEPDQGDAMQFRCPECAKCIVCKQSGKKKAISHQERHEQTIIEKSVTIDTNKKLVFADMPFTKDPVEFLMMKHHGRTDNFHQALQVYKGQCRKSSDNAKEGMRQVLNNLKEKGFVSKLTDLSPPQQDIIKSAPFRHFFPWRVVYKPDSLSTPVRMVVDPTMSGLNLILAKGENKLGRIANIMIKARCKQFIWTSDISKLYNQLKLNDASLPYSLFLFHDTLDVETKPELWVMTSTWYGTGSSGNQADAALERLAFKNKDSHPLALEPLTEGRYVDDLSAGADTHTMRDQQIQQTVQVLSQGGLKLKYVVKSGEVPPEGAASDNASMKFLGYLWNPKNDYLAPGYDELNFNPKVRGAKKPNPEPIKTEEDATQLMKGVKITRRVVVSKVAEFYDPIGLWEPFKLQLKLELSKLNGREWNQELSKEEQEDWKSRFLHFTNLHKMKTPRCTIPEGLPPDAEVRLLCISDAAANAGGAAIYASYRLPDGNYSCSLLTAKSRLLDGTIPRNELSAIMLMTELAHTVKMALGDTVKEILYFTDSTAAMCWCFSTTKRLRLYVLNRVSLIRQLIEWTTGKQQDLPLFHIEGNLNIADLLTKTHDISPEDLGQDSNWQSGLPWMRLPLKKMPIKTYEDIKMDAILQQEVDRECFQEPFFPAAQTSLDPSHCGSCKFKLGLSEWQCYGNLHDFDHCNECTCPVVFTSLSLGRATQQTNMVNLLSNGWTKGIKIMSLVSKFILKSIHKAHGDRVDPPSEKIAEIRSNIKEKCILCKNGKETEALFAKEGLYMLFRKEAEVIRKLKTKKKLSEYDFHNGILWYSGRLAETRDLTTHDLDFRFFFDQVDIKDVLPVVRADSELFYSYAMFVHLHILPHAGVENTMREIAKKMFVVDNPRRIIQRIRQDCTHCRRLLKKTMELRMSKHHVARSTIAPPFYNAMADIAFGFVAKPYYGARKTHKVYALVIVCLLTSSTNILILEGLQTQNVIQAIERHGARYGMPKNLFVDNGTQLVSLQNAEFSLRDVHLHLKDSIGMEIIVSAAKSHESQGRVERKIGLLRDMLARLAIKSENAMTAIQWETCFARISNQLDDLPMAKQASATSDIGWDIITPNRLKLGRNNHRSLEGPVSLPSGSGPDMLLRVNQQIQNTWYTIFLERLHHLIPKPPKWNKTDVPQKGDIVLFVETDGLKAKESCKWKLAKVVDVHPSGSKVTVEFCAPIPPGKQMPKKRTLVRKIREVSVIFSTDDVPINTQEHFLSCIKDAEK